MIRVLLWQKLAQKIARQIATGFYPVGTILPTEWAIVEKEHVSRNTVRSALTELKRHGLIESKPRVGTVVISRGSAENFHQRISTLNDINKFGHEYLREIFDIRLVTTDKNLADELSCAKGMRFLQFSNIRHGLNAEDPPIVYTTVYIDPIYGDMITKAREHPNLLMIDILADLYGTHCTEVRQSIEAVALPDTIAKRLSAQPREPALKITRHYLDPKNHALQISVSYHPGKRYAFNMAIRQNERY